MRPAGALLLLPTRSSLNANLWKQQQPRLFSSSSTTTSKDGADSQAAAAAAPKSVWERVQDYFLFRPGAPGYASMPRKPGATSGGYRTPSPASQGPAVVPTVEAGVDPHNIQYYTRDVRRNLPRPEVAVAGLKNALPESEIPQIPINPLGSPGRPNPAVARYDATGTRSAMTATYKGMNAELAKHFADHLPTPWYLRKENAHLVEAEKKLHEELGISAPAGYGRSMGVPRTKNIW